VTARASLLRWVFLPGMLMAFLVPVLVFLACALLADLTLADSLRETGAQFVVERRHLWGVGVLGLIPVLLLTGLGWVLGRWLEPIRTRCICQAGLLGIAHSGLGQRGVLARLSAGAWLSRLPAWP